MRKYSAAFIEGKEWRKKKTQVKQFNESNDESDFYGIVCHHDNFYCIEQQFKLISIYTSKRIFKNHHFTENIHNYMKMNMTMIFMISL